VRTSATSSTLVALVHAVDAAAAAAAVALVRAPTQFWGALNQFLELHQNPPPRQIWNDR